MKSFYRWLSEHTGLCKLLLLLVLTAFTLYGATFEYVSFLTIYLIDLLIWFVFGRFLAAIPAKLLAEPMELMDQQCDPYPFLEECGRQLEGSRPGPQQQLIQINQATGLRLIGENYKVAGILEDIHIDRFPGCTPYVKYVYYNNLADVLFALERTSEALIWHKKAMQIYGDLPPVQAEKFYGQSMLLGQAQALYHQGEYTDALKKVTWMKCETPRHLLNAALLAARCHIALEEPEKAREKLQYVIEHGNKLCYTREAEALLDTLN